MKKIFSIVIAILTISIGYSQENSSQITHGIQYSLSAAMTIDYSLTSNISYVLDRNRISFTIGPSFGKTAKYDRYNGEPKSNSFNIIGGNTSFRYNFTSNEKAVILFFNYDLYLHHYKGSETFIYYDNSQINFDVVEWKGGLCLGNGVSFRIWEQAYIIANAGIGYKIESFKVICDDTWIDGKKGNNGANIILKLSFKYSFKN